MKVIYLVLLLFLALTSIVFGQDDNYIFRNYTEKDGLCDNIIFSMVKDKSNILWVGTQTGLSRFDGKNFYNFNQIQENGIYVSNTIASLCTDINGHLWGATHYGIFKFNPGTGKFNVYFPFESKKENFFRTILSDSKGNVYVGVLGGIMKYNTDANKFERFLNFSNKKNDPLSNLSPGKNNFILDEENHCFWLYLKDGLVKIDYIKKDVICNGNNPQNPLFQKRIISALTKDQTGKFWFYDNTNQKMVCFDPKRLIQVKEIPMGKSGFVNHAATALVDSDDRIWVCSWDYKLKMIDQKNKNYITDINSLGLSNQIGSGFIWSAFEDENHSLWFGTINGISTINSNPQVYKAEKIKKAIPLLDSIRLRGVEEDPGDKSWWVSTYSANLLQYFPDKGTYVRFNLSDFRANHSAEKPKDVFQIIFANQTVYVLTDRGLWYKDKNSEKFYPFKILDTQPNDFQISYAAFSYPFWYLTNGDKILRYNSDKNDVKWIIDPVLSKNKIQKIFPGKNGAFDVITANNYLVFKYKNDQTNIDSTFCKTLCNTIGYLADAEMDSLGRIWISCKGVGLFMLDSENKSFKSWTDKEGMADKDLHQLDLDKNGNIWGAYWNKLLVYNPKKNNFTNFKIPYSEHKLGYDNYLAKKSDGTIMTIIGDDIFELNINNLNQIPQKIKPSISVISFSGNEFFDTDVDEIKLQPHQNHLRIKYGLLVDPTLFPHTYEYMLEGAESKWNTTNIANEIVYSNLPSGSYTFHIKAINKSANWSSDTRSIRFVISTPLYKRWWFLALCALAVIFGAWTYYTSRVRQTENLLKLQSKAHHLEKEKAQMMFDSLKQQLNPHFLFNSLTSLSALIDADQSLASNFLGQMSDMYRYILKNGDAETVNLKDELTFVGTYYQLQKTRFGKGLLLNVHVDESFYEHLIAPVTLQNMMENAIKHNIIDQDEPLVVDIFVQNGYLIVRNNSQPKKNVETSNKKGLEQFKTLYRYLSDKPIIIEDTNAYFIIKIPLIPNT